MLPKASLYDTKLFLPFQLEPIASERGGSFGRHSSEFKKSSAKRVAQHLNVVVSWIIPLENFCGILPNCSYFRKLASPVVFLLFSSCVIRKKKVLSDFPALVFCDERTRPRLKVIQAAPAADRNLEMLYAECPCHVFSPCCLQNMFLRFLVWKGKQDNKDDVYT